MTVPVLRHGPTYSAHATCCAAALANIALLGRDGLLERGRQLERALLDALAPLASHETVAEVRGGLGLMAAVELTGELLERQPDAVARVTRHARDQGVLVRPLGTAIAVSPPLTVTEHHFALIAEAIDHGLAAVGAHVPAGG